MQCIYCGSPKSKVTETIAAETKVLRKRKCELCGKYFYTKETAEASNQIFCKYELSKRRYQRRSENEKKILCHDNANCIQND